MMHFFTIVLDGEPWIEKHLPVFESLPDDIKWDWSVSEGVAAPIRDTAWCHELPPRLSNDGTTKYLRSIQSPNVFHHTCGMWPGKTFQCNAALDSFTEPGILMQVDADEIWKVEQLVKIHKIMSAGHYDFMRFACNHYVGENLVVDKIPGTWSNDASMWDRVWAWRPGVKFASHEPPRLINQGAMMFDARNDQSLWFDHHSYDSEKQVAFKARYYRGYDSALVGWHRLQNNTSWPAKLREFFPWIKDNTTARPLCQ